MKVYAEFIEENGILFRTKTLLQYGDSWDLIGSIVMKNPGSAKPGVPLNEESKNHISNFFDEKIDFSNWTEANDDATMKKIAPIFNGQYVQKNIELKGIIQIFNILNICDSKIDKAIKNANNTNSTYLFPNQEETVKLFRDKPVYLGFFDFYTDKTSLHQKFMENYANILFKYVKESKFMYLPYDDIIDNPMYHPFSREITKEKSLSILKKFILHYE